MDWSKTLTPKTGLIERYLGDEIVIMSNDGQEIHSFEDTALWIWKRIKDEETPDKIILDLTEEYEVKEDQAREDFLIFVAELREKGILK